MKGNIKQIVNKHGIEGYINNNNSFHVRCMPNSKGDDITINFNSIDDIEGGFESMDIIDIINMKYN